MKMLAIDTATEACSAALYIDGDISQQYRLAPREHSHIILPMIEQLLAGANLGIADLDAGREVSLAEARSRLGLSQTDG